MKNLRNILSAVVMMTVITLGTTAANAGLLISDRSLKSDKNTKQQTCTSNVKYNSGIIVAGSTGIIVAGFAGIIVAGFTGIIVAGASGNVQTECGLLISD